MIFYPKHVGFSWYVVVYEIMKKYYCYMKFNLVYQRIVTVACTAKCTLGL